MEKETTSTNHFLVPAESKHHSNPPPIRDLIRKLRVDWQLSKLHKSKYEVGEWELMTMVGVN